MNADALRQISWQDWRPFRLPLADGELDVRDCLRLLPGKRMACRAIHDGEEVFAKLCFAPDHRRAIAGEASNLGRLADAGVRVPSVRGVVEQPGISVLLLEWLPDARPLADIAVDDWPGALAADFCHQLDSMLAANLIQDDLHLGNFLSAGDGLYVVDAGDIAALEKVSVGRRRDNLALLCAQAPLPDQARLTALVLAHLGGHIDSESRLRDAIQTKLLQRIRHANGKWLRDCSAVALVAQAQATIHLDRTLDPAARETVMSLLDHPEQADTLKQGSRITVYRQANWIIKHYRQASLKMQVKQALGIHPAQRSWRFGWTANTAARGSETLPRRFRRDCLSLPARRALQRGAGIPPPGRKPYQAGAGAGPGTHGAGAALARRRKGAEYTCCRRAHSLDRP
jgi:hypothetical protein